MSQPFRIFCHNLKLAAECRKITREELDLIRSPIYQETDYERLYKSSKTVVGKIFWCAVIACCCCITLYQITDRILYYSSIPLSVDIEVEYSNISPKMSMLKYCVAENDYLVQTFGKELGFVDCVMPNNKILHYDNVSYERVWDFSNSTTTFRSLSVSRNISYNITVAEKSVFGQCSTIEVGTLTGKDLNVVFKTNLPRKRLCDPTIYMTVIKDVVDYKQVWMIATGYDFRITLRLRKFNFQNTPIQNCVDDETFAKCNENCINKLITDTVHCRLPFHSAAINMPKCTKKLLALHSFRQTYKILLRTSATCPCTRACSQRKHTLANTIIPGNKNGTNVETRLDRTSTVFTERLAYELSNLFVDIGGSLGLFLGLCVLSIVNILNIFQHLLSKKISKKTVQKDTAFQVFVKDQCKHQCDTRDNIEKTRVTLTKKIFAAVMLLACISLSILGIGDRIAYYCTFPVNYIVEVKSLSEIYYPSITICGSNPIIAMYKKKYSGKLKPKDVCEVDLLDLLHKHEKFSLDYLWQKSLLIYEKETTDSVMKQINFELMSPNRTTISTHLGDCYHFLFKPELYYGMFSMHLVTLMAASVKNCDENSINVFFDDINSTTYNILTSSKVAHLTQTVFEYSPRTLTRLNVKTRPCIALKDYSIQKQKCVDNLIAKRLTCRLPVYAKHIQLSPCNSTDEAKVNLDEYIKIVVGSTLNKICIFTRPCIENVVAFESLALNDFENIVFSVAFTISSNVLENVIEVEKYDIVSLFCDFGNVLGFALGMSVLTAIESLQIGLIMAAKALNKQ